MNKFITFGLGAAVGSLLTWKILDKKYKKLADEEIESVIEYFKNKDNNNNSTDISEKKEPEYERDGYIDGEYANVNGIDMFKKDYEELKKKLGYDIGVDFGEDKDVFVSTEKDGTVWVEPGKDYIRPYVISPEEFAEIEHYDTQSWTYYSDGVITNSVGEIIVDPETFIGDTLDELGIYEDDSLHVRNENIECDFEIIKCEKSFKELNTATTQENDV